MTVLEIRGRKFRMQSFYVHELFLLQVETWYDTSIMKYFMENKTSKRFNSTNKIFPLMEIFFAIKYAKIKTGGGSQI